MGFFAVHETLEYVTYVKGNVTKEQLIEALHDHDVYMKADAHYISHTVTAEPKKDLMVPPEVEERREPKASATRFYECVDRIPGTAAKFLPGASSSTTYCQFTNTNDGVYIRGDSALDVVVCREFRVSNGPSAGSLQLDETVEIHCSKLLLSVVKGLFSENWTRFHKGYVDRCGGNATVGGHMAFA